MQWKERFDYSEKQKHSGREKSKHLYLICLSVESTRLLFSFISSPFLSSQNELMDRIIFVLSPCLNVDQPHSPLHTHVQP